MYDDYDIGSSYSAEEADVLSECFEEVVEIVGDEFTHETIYDACTQAEGDVDVALDLLYSDSFHTDNTPSSQTQECFHIPTIQPVQPSSQKKSSSPIADLMTSLSVEERNNSALKKATHAITHPGQRIAFKIESQIPQKKQESTTVKANIEPSPVVSESLPPSRPSLISPPYASRKRLSCAIIGHVDSGKSTLIGHLLVLMGTVSERTIKKFRDEAALLKKASFSYAWVLDEHSEERSRGLTMDVSLRRLKTQNVDVTILDTPGHREFVSRAVQSLSEADLGVLVVDSSEGNFDEIFDKGQAKEHVLIAKSFGISNLIVVVNKMDSCEYSQERFVNIKEVITIKLKGIGFKPDDVVFIPVSAIEGQNITSSSIKTDWYEGPTLVEAFESSAVEPVNLSKISTDPLLISILGSTLSDVFGTEAICGKVESGFVGKRNSLFGFPGRVPCVVNSIAGRGTLLSKESVIEGDDVELLLGGSEEIKPEYFKILTNDPNHVIARSKFNCKLIVFDPLLPITKGRHCLLLRNNQTEEVSITKLLTIETKNDLAKKPKVLPNWSRALVVIKSKRELTFSPEPKHRINRFVIRDGNETIGCGFFAGAE
ncbi:hypothetical protein P9112_006659 [Eukaryota sp. TZLM1-RC]